MNNPELPVVSGLELWQWRQQARKEAIAASVPPDEVDWILQEVAGLDRLALRLESFKTWPEIELRLPLQSLNQLWQQRIGDRLPVQYIAGTTPWRHFSLTVSPAVLIPRPETECLIDLAVEAVKRAGERETEKWGDRETGRVGEKEVSSSSLLTPDSSSLAPHPSPPTPHSYHWADLGTGSGAIALGLADAFPSATIHAVDYSPAALSIAQQNAQRLGLAGRVRFYQGSWFEPLGALKGQLRGMVSNPPYIPSDTILELQPEVIRHEPHLALDGGADGLDCIRHLVETAPDYLQPGGIWLIEMMAGQAETVAELLRRQGSYCQIQIHADLAGIDRFALAYRC